MIDTQNAASPQPLTLVPIVQRDGELTVDSRIVADRCGVDHRSVFRLIRQHEASITEHFGVLRFEIAKLGANGRPERFALLTEDQSTFLVTLTRNTAPVVAFKAALVKAFHEARRALEMAGELARPQPLDHPVTQFLQTIDALRSRGISGEKAAFSCGQLFHTSVSSAILSQRTILPMQLPGAPATVPTPAARLTIGYGKRNEGQYQTAFTGADILAVLEREGRCGSGKLCRLTASEAGMGRATFYRMLRELRDAGEVVQDGMGWFSLPAAVVATGGAN